MGRPKNFENMNLIEKWQSVWHRLPREIRVAVWVGLSGIVTAVIDYLTKVEANAVTLALVNLILVFIQNRRQVVTSRLNR